MDITGGQDTFAIGEDVYHQHHGKGIVLEQIPGMGYKVQYRSKAVISPISMLKKWIPKEGKRK